MTGGHVFVDLGPLRRHRDFRLLMTGQLCSSVGGQFVQVAIPLQVFEATHHSTLQVGLVSFAQLVPNLAGSILGGMIADSWDRRNVLWSAQLLLSVCYLGLGLDVAMHVHSVAPLYLIPAFASGVSGIAGPARWAVVPTIVGTADIVPASSIMQIVSGVTTVAGPALAGLLISQSGFFPLYLTGGAASLLTVMTLARMAPLAPAEGGRRISVTAMVEGFRYLRRDRVLSSSFWLDFEAMVFGMPRAVFPALALVLYHGGALTYGLLNSAPAIGALLSALLSGWVARVRRQGLGVIVCVLIWGSTIAAVGFIKVLVLGVCLLAIAGGADTVSVVFRNTILQTTVPDHLRGRLTASMLALAAGGNRLGDTEAGFAASLGGAQFAVWSGGLACVLGALVFLWRVPELAAFDQRMVAAARENGGTEGQPAAEAGAP